MKTIQKQHGRIVVNMAAINHIVNRCTKWQGRYIEIYRLNKVYLQQPCCGYLIMYFRDE